MNLRTTAAGWLQLRTRNAISCKAYVQQIDAEVRATFRCEIPTAMPATLAFVLVLSILPSPWQSESDDVKAKVARLIPQLDADKYAARSAARETLIKLGPDILPLLVAPDDASDNLQGELESIRRTLQNERATGSLKPKLVTLSGTLTVDQVIDRVRKQSGNRLSVAKLTPEQRGRKLDLSYVKTPFWKVVTDLSERLKADIVTKDGSVQLIPNSTNAASSVHESFLVTLDPRQSKPLVGDSSRSLLRLPLSLAPEPRTRALFANVLGSGLTVRTRDGTVLQNYSPAATLELPFAGRGEHVRWMHDVLVPKGTEANELDVKGELSVLMAAGYEQFEFKDLRPQRRPRIRRMGVDLSLEDVDTNESRGEVSITITVGWKRAVAVFDSYRTWQFHNEAWLKTSEGKRLEFKAPLTIDAHVGGAVQLTYRFVGLDEPVRFCSFIYEAPSTLETVRVPFRFRVEE